MRSTIGIWFVMIGRPRYICIASPLMISPLNRAAKSTASCLYSLALLARAGEVASETGLCGRYYLGLAGARGANDGYEGIHDCSARGRERSEGCEHAELHMVPLEGLSTAPCSSKEKKNWVAAVIAGFLIGHYLICDRWQRTLTSDRVTRSNSDTTLPELDKAIACDSFWNCSCVFSIISFTHTHFSSRVNSSSIGSTSFTPPAWPHHHPSRSRISPTSSKMAPRALNTSPSTFLRAVEPF